MVLFRLSLGGMRAQILWYGLGLAAWAGLEVVLFPTVRETLGAVEYPEELLAAFGAAGGDLSDPRTFFDLEVFSLAPLVAAAFALFAGTGALAGEESAGTMELLASFPLSRRRILAEKVLAITCAATGIVALACLGWVLTVPFANLGSDLPRWELVVATFAQLPFMAFMATAALFFGAVAPSRSTAAGITAVLLIASYLFVVIAAVDESVEQMRYLSPYYYTDLQGILADGLQGEHQLVLWTLTAVTAWLALRAIEGREYGSERWQFGAVLHTQYRAADAPAGDSAPTRMLRALPSRRRGGSWWAGALLLVTVAGAAAGAAYGFGTGPGLERVVTAEGRIDADKVNVLMPAGGLIRQIDVVEDGDVLKGQALGWFVHAVDGSMQPVLAPFTGRVTHVGVQVGQVQPAGAVFAVVHDMQSLRAVLEVNEDDINDVVTGQRVTLTLTGPGVETTAVVSAVATAPLASSTSRSGQASKYEVRCLLSEPDPRVSLGMLVDARIHVDASSGR